jgi:CO dehydrogenase maturation factor
MKLAIAGKGGVGKTTLAALLAYIYAGQGQKVIAIDADPAASLANALGLPPDLASQAQPIAEMDALIEERTGAKPGTVGGYFKLNPRVDDIPDRFSVTHRGVKLLRLGTIRGGGAGCICPESAMLKALVTHLVLYQNETLIMDMEAGLEHLGRATAGAVDAFIAVAEPGRRSLDTAHRIQQLAAEIGVKTVYLVANKIHDEAELEFVRSNADGLTLIGRLPFDQAAGDADRRGIAIYDASPRLVEAARQVADILGQQR